MKQLLILTAALSLMLFAASCSHHSEPNGPAEPSVVDQANDLEFGSFTPTSPSAVCTRTISYWRNHSEFGPGEHDPTWATLRNGASTPFAGTGKTYLEISRMSETGLGTYYILARQFIAAKLNARSGARVPPEIQQAGTHAMHLLGNYDGSPHRMNDIRRSVRIDFLRTAAVLWSYNIGLVGPGNCAGQGNSEAFPVIDTEEANDVE